MSTEGSPKKKKWFGVRILLIAILSILFLAGFFLYINVNRLLSEALLKSFNSNIISDVYELKFEKLTINPLERSLRVYNATLQPREKPLNDYPYINSSFSLKAERLTLINVELFSLLRSNILNVERIAITKPDVELQLNGSNYVLLPFNDSTFVARESEGTKKISIGTFNLVEFQLIDASLHTINSNKQREFEIKKFNFSLYDLIIGQQEREYMTSFNRVVLGIGDFNGSLQKGPVQQIGFNNFNIGIDSLNLQLTKDTLIYRFHDFRVGVDSLDIQTTDSLFHVTMKSFVLSYQEKSINLKAVSFKPNVSHAALQKDHQFQHVEFSGSVATLNMIHVNFDSLLYAKKFFIDDILIDSVEASIFKDKTKSLDTTRFPIYLDQSITNISQRVLIKNVKATHVQLANTERLPDSTLAKVKITRATVDVKNITNLDPKGSLTIEADAYIEGKAHFIASLNFPYSKPQFGFQGVVKKFNLVDLNSLIQNYTPVKINTGVLDELTFSGLAENTKASGTLKFLYHDMNIDIELQKAKWTSGLLAFAANTVLASSNPGSADLPPRVVQFHIDRNMNKGFVNVLIKSILNGLKETMIMSKENKKTYKEAKQKMKEQNTK